MWRSAMARTGFFLAEGICTMSQLSENQECVKMENEQM